MVYREQFNSDLNCYGKLNQVVIIASTGRSGSHMLGHDMISTGQLGMPFEYFNQINLNVWKEKFGKHNISELILDIIKSRTSECSGVFSIKLHYSHIEDIGIEKIQEMFPNAKYIFIRRENITKQAISMVIAKQTGKWINNMPGNGVTPSYSRKLIDLEIKDIIKDNASWIYYLNSNRIDYHEVVFENYLKDPTSEINEILRYCGIEESLDTITGRDMKTTQQSNAINGEWYCKYNAERKINHLFPFRFNKAIRKMKILLKPIKKVLW
ncbi:Stf0 family sulfotransferase [Vibrio cyclitrophicus]